MSSCRRTGCLDRWRSTEDGDSGEFDVFVESDISEAVDEVDEFAEVVEEGFVSLLKFLHSDILFEYRFTIDYDIC